jgi:prepilin-type processing-associated H-X9-DG protein
MPPNLSALRPDLEERILVCPRVGWNGSENRPYNYRPIKNPSKRDVIAWDIEAHEFAGRIPGTHYFQRNVLFADGRVRAMDEATFDTLPFLGRADP